MFGFSIREILPHIYHLHFESAYELSMHFLRFTEYYESPKFHKQVFTLVDYMEWYSKEHGNGSFTYASDWSGFNVPSWVLHQVRIADIPDPNKYDRFMFSLIDWVESKEHPHNYYFVGTSTAGYKGDEDEESVLDHEMAHGLYKVHSGDRSRVQSLLGAWAGAIYNPAGHKGEELDSARQVLKTMGYHASIIDDEVQAYCATDLCEELEGVISEREMEPFRKLFQEYKKKCTREASK